MMKCPECGADIVDGGKFCSACGAPAPVVRETSKQGGVQVGDVGYVEGGITDASTHGSASVGAINVHLGRMDMLNGNSVLFPSSGLGTRLRGSSGFLS